MRALRRSYAVALWCFLPPWLPGLVAEAQTATTSEYPSVLSYRTIKVATGVYAFIAPEERTGFQAGNSIAVVGDSVVLMFDAGAMPSVTRRQIAELRKLTNKPVRYVVTSHWHPDHNLGNNEYRQAFPEVRFVGTRATRQGITDRAAHFIEEVKGFGPTDSLMRLRLSTGKMRDGSDMPPRIRTMFELNTRDFGEFMPAVSEAVPLTSDQVFDDSLTIQLGGRVVKVMTMGRGNTAGDAFAYIPDASVLLTGDLLTFPCPFPSTAYFIDWLPVMDRLRAIRATRIVPGHGEVQMDYAFLDKTRALLQYTKDKAADAVKRGLTLEKFTAEISFAEFTPTFAGTDVVRTEAFDNFYVSEAVPRAFLEASLAAKGQLAPPYPER
jgi:glyoxylase-like metal-dependent hydrolase (beta-lactamase superfamily II)